MVVSLSDSFFNCNIMAVLVMMIVKVRVSLKSALLIKLANGITFEAAAVAA